MHHGCSPALPARHPEHGYLLSKRRLLGANVSWEELEQQAGPSFNGARPLVSTRSPCPAGCAHPHPPHSTAMLRCAALPQVVLQRLLMFWSLEAPAALATHLEGAHKSLPHHVALQVKGVAASWDSAASLSFSLVLLPCLLPGLLLLCPSLLGVLLPCLLPGAQLSCLLPGALLPHPLL